MMKRALVFVCLLAAGPAPAQPGAAAAGPDISLGGATANGIAALAALASPAGVAIDAGTAANTRFRRVPGGSNAAVLLAAHYPLAARADATATFTTLLAAVPEIEAQYGLAPNDMATAAALFISGAYSAYTGRSGPEARFAVLVRQMRAILASKPALAAASDRDKQAAFDQLAILGLLTESTVDALEKNPGAANAAGIRANLRGAGKRYLEAFLGTDAALVRLGPAGLVLASGDPAPRGGESPTATNRKPVTAPPGRTDKITNVVLVRSAGTGYNSMVTLAFRPRILFRDGTYSADPETALGQNPLSMAVGAAPVRAGC